MVTDMKLMNQNAIKEAEKLETTKDYETFIKELRDKPLKQKVLNMLTDERFNKEKSFELESHKHITKPNRAERKACILCKYEKREVWLQSLLNNLSGNETTNKIDVNNIIVGASNLKKIKVIRGSDDDVIGWSLEWQ